MEGSYFATFAHRAWLRGSRLQNCQIWWAHLDSNQEPTDYESAAFMNILFILLEFGPITGPEIELTRLADCNPLVPGWKVRYKNIKGP